jgi:CRP/FNR family cyclic AMP-dependent transcriptional regulator
MNANELRQLEIFQELSDSELNEVNAVMFRQKYSAKTVLFSTEEHAETMYIILSGTVKIIQNDNYDSTVILAILGKGQFLGEMAIIDGLGRSADAITREPTVLLKISRNDFWSCMSRINNFAYSVARVLCNRVRVADEKIRLLATQDVRTRLARQITMLASDAGNKLPDGSIQLKYKITQTDLAEMVGATRTRVNQLLRPWKKNGAIKLDSDGYFVVNNDKMAKFC